MKYLLEDSRAELIQKGKKGARYRGTWAYGKNRYQRRVHSSVANTVKDYNAIDMNKLFKDGILSIFIKIKGETDAYSVGISFGGFCEILHDQIKNDEEVSLRHIVKTILTGINKSDVFIECDCPDYQYRFRYWNTQTRINMGVPENRPSNITNPNNSLGSGCKHCLLALNNTVWCLKVASVINNYITYIKDNRENLYAKVIYPAIYKKEYKKDTQTNLDNDENAENEIDTAIEYGRNKPLFKKGNTQGIRFAKSRENPDEILLVDEE